MNRRQLTIVIGALAFIVIAGWIVFFFFMKKPQQQATLPTLAPSFAPQSPQPTVSQGPQAQFVKLTDDQVADPEAGAQNVVFFDIKDQLLKVMSLALNTNQTTQLSQTPFQNITDALWAPNHQAIILISNHYDTMTYYTVDLTQNLQYDLPDYMQDPAWSPDSKQIAFYHWNPVTHDAWIATVKADGTNEKKIIAPGLGENVQIAWPTQDTILFYEKPTPLMPMNALFSYSLKTKQLSAISLPTGESQPYGFDALPSPDGSMLLVQFTSSNGSVVSSYIAKGTQLTQLPFATLVQKCAWAQDNSTVYCAFPQTWNVGSSMLPFDYWRGIITTNDSFGSVNISNGQFTTYASNTPYDAANVSVSPDQTFLIFINRNDLSLYKMRIK